MLAGPRTAWLALNPQPRSDLNPRPRSRIPRLELYDSAAEEEPAASVDDDALLAARLPLRAPPLECVAVSDEFGDLPQVPGPRLGARGCSPPRVPECRTGTACRGVLSAAHRGRTRPARLTGSGEPYTLNLTHALSRGARSAPGDGSGRFAGLGQGNQLTLTPPLAVASAEQTPPPQPPPPPKKTHPEPYN
jgi:hypothetical protein